MTPKAILFGSIGTLADTSEMQRRAFNDVFAEAGLDWQWDRATYRSLLEAPGGARRIADFAASRHVDVDAAKLHAAKVARFETLAREEGLRPRDGVADLILAAVDRDVRLGFVTETTPRTVRLILQALDGYIPPAVFDVVTNATMVKTGKPAPDVYRHALATLNLQAETALAVEDTPEAARASVAAGIATVAFPNAMAQGRSFPGTVATRDTLGADLLDFDLRRAAA